MGIYVNVENQGAVRADGAPSASSIPFNNTESGSSANNVQDAIDETYENLSKLFRLTPTTNFSIAATFGSNYTTAKKLTLASSGFYSIKLENGSTASSLIVEIRDSSSNNLLYREALPGGEYARIQTPIMYFEKGDYWFRAVSSSVENYLYKYSS